MPFGLFSIASQSSSIGLTMRFAVRLHGGIANVIPTSPFRAFFRCINGERLCGHIAAPLEIPCDAGLTNYHAAKADDIQHEWDKGC
jgi:hypothetical protein